jgi:hypothetical protein
MFCEENKMRYKILACCLTSAELAILECALNHSCFVEENWEKADETAVLIDLIDAAYDWQLATEKHEIPLE